MSGIMNLGQNCFVSVVVHMLATVQDGIEMLEGHEEAHTDDTKSNCTECLLLEMITKVNSRDRRTIQKNKLIPFLKSLGINYKRPGDPRELLARIILEVCPTLQIILSAVETKLYKCDVCDKFNEVKSTVPILTVDDAYGSTVQDHMNSLKQPNIIADYNCPICESENVIARVTTSYPERPKFVIIHKTHANESSLDYVLSIPRDSGGDEIYYLDGFVEIVPSPNLQQNHYIYHRKIGTKWLRFNDGCVSIILHDERYCFFLALYRRHDVEPFNDFIDPGQYRDLTRPPKKQRQSPNDNDNESPEKTRDDVQSSAGKRPNSRTTSNKELDPAWTPEKESHDLAPKKNNKKPKRSTGKAKKKKVTVRTGRKPKTPQKKVPKQGRPRHLPQGSTDLGNTGVDDEAPKEPDVVIGTITVEEPQVEVPKAPKRTRAQAKKALRGIRKLGIDLVTPRPKSTRKSNPPARLQFASWKTMGIGRPQKKQMSEESENGDGTSGKRKRVSQEDEEEEEDPTYVPDRDETETDESQSQEDEDDESKIRSNEVGKRSSRGDKKGEKIAKYSYLKWQKPSRQGALHKSHTSSRFKGDYKSSQKVPGFCILCPRKFYGINPKEMAVHWKAVHFKSKLEINTAVFLLCKCSDVPDRGCDGRTRNRHYHCLCCHKPVENRFALAKHLITRHSVEPTTVEHLISQKKRQD